MPAPRVFGLAALELRRFRTPLQRMALVFAVCVPLLYGALYLWSNWEPYQRLDRIPVAVVNEDRPVTVDGEQVDAGALFVAELRRDPIFDWRFVDAAEADRGVHDGDYYFLISVPPDFSAKLASGATGTPQRASMQIVLNDANGYVVGKMAQTVQSKLENQIDAAAVSAYFQSVFGNLDRLRAGMTEAADGATRLRDGAHQLTAGTGALVDGIGQLKTGAQQLAPGARQVADGVGQIAAAVGPAADRIADALPTVGPGATRAATGAAELTATAANAAAAVDGGADSVRAALAELGRADPTVAAQPAYQAAVAAADRAAARTAEVSTGADRLRDTTATVAAGMTTLAGETPQLQQRVRQAASDVRRLSAGAAAVADGAARLDAGLGEAQSGAQRLDAGAVQLSAGADALATGLTGALDELPVLSPDQQRRDAATLAAPVDVGLTNLNPAGVYGRGIAPMFFAIALWVFGMVAFLLLQPLSARARASVLGNVPVALAGYLPAALGALVATALLYGVVEFGLGLDPVHVWANLGLLALAAATFIAIAHALRIWLGGVANAVLLVLLIAQLTSCGGVYPVETLPAPLRALHPVLPMSYLVDGLRVTISGGSGAHLLGDAAVLAGFLIVALVLGVVATARKRCWSIAELKPELVL
ncbi:YhgE/Pip family protein [Pseudonocardia hispaniensis]|uniref:YhgE/Pip family protein n=1 Tax=Pseudonocardia hispaniensis TaxID=904933 RepID=A0ABW1J119_9PSEU